MLRKGGSMKLSRKRIALALAVVLPALSVMALSIPPWRIWLPEVRNVGLPWLYATVALGGIGIMLLPTDLVSRLAGLVIYVPLMLLILTVVSLALGCFAQGPHACP
jgi:hypothetical protein